MRKWISILAAAAIVVASFVPVVQAVTVTIDQATVFGNMRVTMGRVALDSAYPTGGESVTAGNLGLENVHLVLFQSWSGYQFAYDYGSEKLIAYQIPDTTGSALVDSTAMTQVQANKDLSGVDSVRFVAFGN